MEYGLSGSSEHEFGGPRGVNAPGSSWSGIQSSELQRAIVRGAGELRDVERRIQRIKTSTERVLASSLGLVPAYSPFAAEIAAAVEEAEEAQRQLGFTRAFLENSTGSVVYSAEFPVLGPAGSLATARLHGGGFAGPLLRQPSVEVRDTGKDFIVRVELPGMTKEDIDVQAAESSLRVVAEQQDEAIEEGHVVSAERLARQLERTVPLPEYVVPSKAAATFRDGILEVTLPKKHPGEPAQRLTLK
jgi:HSP20 family molecular chaperone IbpA